MRLSAEGFSFHTTDGLDWPASRATLAWRQPAGQALVSLDTMSNATTGGEFSADRLDLALLARLAERLPLPGPLRGHLAEMAPQGLVTGLQAQWQGPPAQPTQYRVQAKLQGLAIASLPAPGARGVGRPGIRNADLTLDANETGGQAQLALQSGALLLPGVFADPELLLDRFNSRLVWHITSSRTAGKPPQVELLLQDAHFANADAQGDIQLRWRTGPGSATALGKGARLPGQLALSGQLVKARAAAVSRYLPLGVAASARDYVAAAVREGSVPRATFKVQGDLWDFPFAQGQDGEFHVAVQVEQGTLAYIPAAGTETQWPPFTQVRGELIFDRGSMAIRNAEARLWGVALKNVNGAIPDLTQHPALHIDGAGQGPLVDALRYMAATPLGGWTDDVLREATAAGQAALTLGLHIPLDDTHRSTVSGEVTLADNTLRLRPDVPLLTHAQGRISFTERGFAIAGGAARALGGEVAIDGGSQADGSVRVNVQGSANAEAVRQATELGPLTRLASALSGQAPYRLQLGFHRGQAAFNLTSPMTGMAVELPAPLHKAAADSLALRVQTTLGPEGGANATRDTLRIDLGTVFQAEYLRDLSGSTPRVLRGGIGLGEPLPALPAAGVQATARFGVLNVDAWQAALRPWMGEGVTTTTTTTNTVTTAAAGAASDYLPTDLALKAQELTAHGHALSQLQATAQRRVAGDGVESWRGALQSEQAQGRWEWQAPANGPQRFTARLARLSLSPAEATGAAPPPAARAADPPEPAALPGLDIVVDDLSWRGHKLGRLALEATGAPAGAREWRLGALSLASADARLAGSGVWSAAQRRMALDLKLDLVDSGALLERLGMGAVLRGGAGHITGQLAWGGSPFSPALGQLSGAFKLGLDSGQFLKVEPGAARLLSVLSLQSLPRRFTLDFRDVFQKGFAFDNVSGDLSLADGVARTNNLRIRGLQAAVLLEGQADLKRETQDLHMVVVPEINAGTASLAYAAINPAVGLGTFLAQFLFRGTLQEAGTREFRITGPWDQPSVEPIERTASPSLHDLDGPAAAASAADLVAR